MNIERRKFNGMLLGLAAVTGFAGISPTAVLAQDASAVLQAADAIRNPQSSFIVNVDLKDYKGRSLAGQTQVTTYSRRAGGQFQTLVHINAPSVDRGKLLLRNGANLWIFDPASRASVRMSPRQRLLGNASNGDVVTANLLADYSAAVGGRETIADGDRQNRDCIKLNLTSRSGAAAYSSIEYWVDAASNRPVKGKYYTGSGNLLKVSWFRGYRNAMGAARPTEVIIADGFNPSNVTVMTMSGYRAADLPESWFSKDWLPNFKV